MNFKLIKNDRYFYWFSCVVYVRVYGGLYKPTLLVLYI